MKPSGSALTAAAFLVPLIAVPLLGAPAHAEAGQDPAEGCPPGGVCKVSVSHDARVWLPTWESDDLSDLPDSL
ncbi:hypothetical protein [Kitasatospora cineracea]|uniref:hypothetical protein n=1 Tax=Kitasatospora cineracea TaxID=88074 RepID=UPI0038140E89